MTQILKGRPVAEKIYGELMKEMEELQIKGITPTLGIVRVGTKPDDIAYENSIVKSCNSIGVSSKVIEVDEHINMDEFIKVIENINEDKRIHGILLFRPLPVQLDIDVIKNIILASKDIDCMNPINLGKTFKGGYEAFAPCTAKAVVAILKHYNIKMSGANVAIINSSLVVGRPLSMLLLDEDATVTLCHSKTRCLSDITLKADIVVTAVGKAKIFQKEIFNSNSVVIDVGINDDGNGGICGDVDAEGIIERVKALTPVPGGVGTVTTAILLSHVVKACKNQYNQ